VEVDARSSDAIALALRFGCPIHSFEFILAAAGLRMENEDEPEQEPAQEGASTDKKNIRTSSPEDLRQLLDEAIENEDYERASKLRDELKRREGTN
ncbi:MAG: bifunctional nuclease domain-containing protein, partial [Flavobacteriales bacterium]